MTESLSSSLLFTWFFVGILGAAIVTQLWLAGRQARHVATHRDHVPTAFAESISLTAHQKAADYTLAKIRWGFVEIGLNALILLGWTLLGGLDLLNRMTLEWLGPGLLQQIAVLTGFALIAGLVDLPSSLYQTFVLEQRFGFNKTTPKLWLSDLVKSVLVGAAIGLPIATLMLWLMGAAGNSWWLWAWLAWTALNLLMMLIYPSFIAPLFNKFKPLEDESLKARVMALMARCGFAAKGLFVMDGSRRSAHGNAYFTGFGASKRVVFYDTLLAKLVPAEVEAVLAHELGHFKHRHLVKRMALLFTLSLAGFALLGDLSMRAWFYAGLGVSPNLQGANDALALILFMLALPVPLFFVSPLAAQLSRRHEFEADAFAVKQTSRAHLRSALLKLYEDNASTLTPDPVYTRFYYTHPPASERLARMAQTEPAAREAVLTA